jgi:hypothetical protein
MRHDLFQIVHDQESNQQRMNLSTETHQGGYNRTVRFHDFSNLELVDAMRYIDFKYGGFSECKKTKIKGEKKNGRDDNNDIIQDIIYED